MVPHQIQAQMVLRNRKLKTSKQICNFIYLLWKNQKVDNGKNGKYGDETPRQWLEEFKKEA